MAYIVMAYVVMTGAAVLGGARQLCHEEARDAQHVQHLLHAP